MSNEVKVSFKGDYSDLKRTAGAVKAEIAGIGKEAKKQSEAMKILRQEINPIHVALAAAAASAAAFYVQIDKLGRVQDLSERTGLSPEFLQAIDKTATKAGSSMESVAKSVAKFSKELIYGDDETGKLAGTIWALGLSVDALKQQSPEEIFVSVASAVSAIEDPTQRTAAAMTLFGKSGAELIPILGEVVAATKAVDVQSAETVAAVDELGDAFGDMTAEAGQGIAGLVAAVAGPLTSLINWMREMIATAKSLGAGAGELLKSFDVDKANAVSEEVYGKLVGEIYRKNDSNRSRKDRGISSPDLSDINAGGDKPGSAKPDKPKPDELPSEKALREFLDDKNSYRNGVLRNPGVLRRLQSKAERDRAREDLRKKRGVGGPATFNQGASNNAAGQLADQLGLGVDSVAEKFATGGRADALRKELFGAPKPGDKDFIGPTMKVPDGGKMPGAKTPDEPKQGKTLDDVYSVLDTRLPKRSAKA